MAVKVGQQAEVVAERWLLNQGYNSLGRNWRNRFSELDLVVEKDSVVHFVEVKYRSNPAYGAGFEYITPDKRRRLVKAAQAWMFSRQDQRDYQIDVISIGGDSERPQLEYLPNCVELNS